MKRVRVVHTVRKTALTTALEAGVWRRFQHGHTVLVQPALVGASEPRCVRPAIS